MAAIAVVVMAAVVGWIMNLVTIFQTFDAALTGELIIRVAGIFLVPIGAVMGYI